MAQVPFHECAFSRHEEAGEAREKLFESLDELRAKADRFVTVVESTAALFAALARSPERPHSKIEAYRGHLEPDGSMSEAPELKVSPACRPLALGANGSGGLPLGTSRNGAARYPDATPLGTVRLAPGIPQAIVTPNVAKAKLGEPFSFTVRTMGRSLPSLTQKGDLPDRLRFTDNENGSATISGTPETQGEFRFTVEAKFGKGATKYVAVQTFTLTVRAND